MRHLDSISIDRYHLHLSISLTKVLIKLMLTESVIRRAFDFT